VSPEVVPRHEALSAHTPRAQRDKVWDEPGITFAGSRASFCVLLALRFGQIFADSPADLFVGIILNPLRIQAKV